MDTTTRTGEASTLKPPGLSVDPPHVGAQQLSHGRDRRAVPRPADVAAVLPCGSPTDPISGVLERAGWHVVAAGAAAAPAGALLVLPVRAGHADADLARVARLAGAHHVLTYGDDDPHLAAAALDRGATDHVVAAADGELAVARLRAARRRHGERAALAARLDALDRLSATDALTGLANRRQIEADLEAAHRAAAGAAPLGVVLVDLDGFKRVNDDLGHHVGDEVLAVIACVLEVTAPPGARVGRWGGDEFLAVLPGCGLEDVAAWAEQARARVHELPPVCGRPLSISAGCAAWAPTPAAMVNAADEAMYRAKRCGRDAVAAAGR